MKNNGLLHSLCLLLSVFLYYKAPNEVDFFFNLTCFVIFLLQAITVLRKDIKRDSILTFNTLFLFSFFFVSYAFPLFIWGTPLFEREGIQAYINYNVACKCTALCTVAISTYFLSYSLFYHKSYSFGGKTQASHLSFANVIFLITFLALFIKTLTYLRYVGGIAVDVGQWYNVYMASLPLCLLYNCEKRKVNNFRRFVSKNIHILTPAIALVILFLILGDRGLVMLSLIIIAGVYSYKVKRIKSRFFIIGILLGSILMYSLKVTRTTESSLSSGDTSAYLGATRESLEEANFITLFADLTQIHHELYIGYEYWERNGLLEPMQCVIIPFYPFPYLPSLLSNILFNKSIDSIKPGVMLNEYMSYSGYGHFGIHCVIDVFMRYGMIGVILIFFLWGFLVSSIMGSKERSIVGFAMFIILLGSAIRLPRAPLLDITRIFFWVIMIVWFSGLLSRRLKRSSF